MIEFLEFIYLAYACDTKEVRCSYSDDKMYVCYVKGGWPFLKRTYSYDGETITVINAGRCHGA